MPASRMLIVEDDPQVGTDLEDFFVDQGYEVRWTREGVQAVKLLITNPGFDVAVINLGLPKKNGFDVIREARTHGVTTPIIILSGRSSEKDKLKGFDLGADDYVTKPFSKDELAARCRVIIKRGQNNHKEEIDHYVFDDLDINFSSHTASKNGEELQFTALEFSILYYFIQHRGRTVSRRQLLRDVWDIKEDIATRTIDRHVASLRKKIENDATAPKYIQTVYGIGYKFTG